MPDNETDLPPGPGNVLFVNLPLKSHAHPSGLRSSTNIESTMLPRVAITLAFIFTGARALAAKPEPAGTFNAWSVWTYKDGTKKNCYIYSAAKTKSPASLNHGDVSFFVRTVNSSQARTEANFTVGYDFAPAPPSGRRSAAPPST